VSYVLLGLVVVVAVLLTWFHFRLVAMGQGYVVRIAGRNVLNLGLERESIYNGEVKDSFEMQKNDAGVDVWVPKSEANVLFTYEQDGVMYGEDVDTGEELAFRWSPETGYICGTMEMMAPPPQLGLEFDVKRDLKNYTFFAYGDSWRGTMGENGLATLRLDAKKGDPVKVYLKVQDEKSEVMEPVMVVLFTSNEMCSAGGYEPSGREQE